MPGTPKVERTCKSHRLTLLFYKFKKTTKTKTGSEISSAFSEVTCLIRMCLSALFLSDPEIPLHGLYYHRSAHTQAQGCTSKVIHCSTPHRKDERQDFCCKV